MAEQVSQEVLLRIAANTEQAIRELKKLGEKGEEESKKLIKGFADVQSAINLASKAWGFAANAAEQYGRTTQLQAAAAGISIDGLREATQGLVADQKLLELAAKANASQFKLTQNELEGVTRGMVALTSKGFELTEVLQKTEKFLVEGNAKGLEDFGLRVRGATGSVEAFRSGLSALTTEGEKAVTGVGTVGHGFQKAGVSIQNAMDSITNSLGRMAVQLAPLVEKLAQFIEFSARAIDPEGYYKSRGVKFDVEGGLFAPSLISNNQEELVNTFLELGFGKSRRDAEARASQAYLASQEDALARGTAATSRALGIFGGVANQIGKKSRGDGPLGISDIDGMSPEQAIALEQARRRMEYERPSHGNTDLGIGRGVFEGSALPGDLTGPGTGTGIRGFFGRNLIDPLRQQMDQFGLPEYIETLNLGTQAFGTFQTAAVSALTSVALGTESLGGAFKKLGATFLVSTGQQLLGTALQESVMALVSLASRDFPGAALHAKAAGAAGIAAAGSFALARALGAGSTGAGARAAPATAGLGGAGAAAGGAGGGTSTTTIIAGAEWASFSPSQRRAATRRTLEQAGVSNDPHATVVYA